VEDAERVLRLLFCTAEQDYIELRSIVPGEERRVQRGWWQLSQLSPLLKTAALWSKIANVYFGVQPRNARSGKTSAIPYIHTLFADIDRLTYPVNMPAPTITVLSGRGLHVYWKLSQPIKADKDALDLLHRAVRCAGGDENARDFARILRVPGTRNHKVNTVVEIYDCTEKTYDIRMLNDIMPRIPTPPKVYTPSKQFVYKNEVVPSFIMDMVQHVSAAGEWNKDTLKIATRSVKCGASEDIIDALTTKHAILCGKTDRVHELERRAIVKWARQNVQEAYGQ
jgi:hypothetical protein